MSRPTPPSGRTLRQAGRFTVVGVLATAVNIAVALLVHRAWELSPLWSNFAGFLAAVALSYGGNWFWTFDAGSRHRFAVPRFAAVALLGFAINQAIVFCICTLAGLALWVAMVPVAIVVPAVSFWLNKTRVFLASPQAAA